MSVLSLNKISYSYKNGKNILDDISIEFEKGKFYVFQVLEKLLYYHC